MCHGKRRARSQRTRALTRSDGEIPHSQLLDVPGLAHLFGVSEAVAFALVVFDDFPAPAYSGRAWGFDVAAVVIWARARQIPRFCGG